MTNKRVNYGSMKCIYSINLPFDLDCAHISFTVMILQVKVYMSESTLYDKKMIKSFHDLDYKIIDFMSVKCTHVQCTPASCLWYSEHVYGALGNFFKFNF